MNDARGEAFALWERLSAEHDRYRALVPVLPPGHERVQEDYRRYLCLRCAGFLEQVTFIVLTGYLDAKSHGPALDVAKKWFRRAPNLKTQVFVDLVGKFGTTHQTRFEEFLEPPRRDILDSLLEIRNDVAHGKVFSGQRLEPSGYMTLCEDIYEWLINEFLGDLVLVVDEQGRPNRYERRI
jgi:hypothetical protein